jgi:pimeloyl-ACP methyl ester carboxylesterase
VTALAPVPASLAPDLTRLPGVDPAWSRRVTVADATGTEHEWHLLDNGVTDPVGTLLCVHGNPTWSYLWRRLVAAAPPGWRVIAPDQLGMGFSERVGELRPLAQRVADLGDLTAALGVTGPVITVGHDWGGVISLGWALQHREQLRGVVLTNTAVAMPPGDLGPALIRLAHAPGVRPAATVGTPLFVRATTALSRPVLPAAVRDAFAAPYASADRRGSVGDFVADIPFTPGHPSRATQEAIAEGIRDLDVPALLLWGPRDPVFGERYLADLRGRLPQAELHRYEGASHLVQEDAPEYAKAIAQWVADLAEGRSPAAARPVAPTPDRHPWSALTDRAADDSPAVVEVGGGTVSWAALSRRVEDLAAGLVAAGIGPGTRVGMLVEPSADLTATVYAVWRAGAVIVVADKGLGLRGMRRHRRPPAAMRVPPPARWAPRPPSPSSSSAGPPRPHLRSPRRTPTAPSCSPPGRPARPRAWSTPSGRPSPSWTWCARPTASPRPTGWSPRSRPSRSSARRWASAPWCPTSTSPHPAR